MYILKSYEFSNLSMKSRQNRNLNQSNLYSVLEPLKTNKKAMIPSGKILKGINFNNGNLFDTFEKIDDATRKINFVKSQDEWDSCLAEEFIEFQEARREYEENKTPQNFDHMQEEMGDIFYTASSIAKNAGINPKEAFDMTLRKNANRLNLMEKMSKKNLAECTDIERKALWSSAKRKLYDVKSFQYIV